MYARGTRGEARGLTQEKSKAQTLSRLLCLVLILAVLTVTLVQELSRSSDAYSFEVATLADYTQADTLTGYVFRDEIAPASANNGPIRYLVGEGEAVSAGTLLAEIFRDDTGTDKRERAAALYAEIEVLQKALDAETDWKNNYLSDYPALMQSIGAGNYAQATAKAKKLAATLGGKECDRAQTADALRERIAAAQAQLAEMVEHTNDPAPILAATDGTYYHTADGYEHVFGTEIAKELTPERLHDLLNAAARPAKGVGKLVSNGTWYLAVPVEKSLADTYMPNTAYTLHFEGGSLSMTLEKITLAANGEDALLLFCADALPAFLSCSRAQRVSVEKETFTGLSIPACALSADHTVYVIRDGAARLCPVTVLKNGKDGTLILAEQRDGTLRAGDRVIVSARQLFDGKVLE